MNPFYFFLSLWGERHRGFFVHYCLPSLLAPGNIPSLEGGQRNKFLICTTQVDWNAIRELPILRLLASYLEPVFLEIPHPDPGVSPCVHMGIGHKLATEMCFRDRAYGVQLTPDLMLSDGTMATAQKHARTGKEIVFLAAHRFGEEPLFAELAALGLIRDEEKLSEQGKPLVLTGRDMVRAGIKSFHSEVLTYEWDAPYFFSFPCAAWWRVPGVDGIVMHSLSWLPILLDYGAVREHDTTALETWSIDGNYVWRNFQVSDRIHVVQDSDEAMVVSWSLLSVGARDLRPDPLQQSRLFGEWSKGSILRATYFSPIFDPLKRKIFPLPVRWHADDLSPAWTKVEKKARRLIDRYVDPDEQRAGVPMGDGPALARPAILRLNDPGMRLSLRTRAGLRVWYLGIRMRTLLAYYLPIMLAAVKGDPIARAKVARSVEHRLARTWPGRRLLFALWLWRYRRFVWQRAKEKLGLVEGRSRLDDGRDWVSPTLSLMNPLWSLRALATRRVYRVHAWNVFKHRLARTWLGRRLLVALWLWRYRRFVWQRAKEKLGLVEGRSRLDDGRDWVSPTLSLMNPLWSLRALATRRVYRVHAWNVFKHRLARTWLGRRLLFARWLWRYRRLVWQRAKEKLGQVEGHSRVDDGRDWVSPTLSLMNPLWSLRALATRRVYRVHAWNVFKLRVARTWPGRRLLVALWLWRYRRLFWQRAKEKLGLVQGRSRVDDRRDWVSPTLSLMNPLWSLRALATRRVYRVHAWNVFKLRVARTWPGRHPGVISSALRKQS